MKELLIALILTLIIAMIFFVSRTLLIRDDTKMRRFLDERYERISRGLLFLRRDEFMNRRSLLQFGSSGLLMLPLVSFNASLLDAERLLGIAGIASVMLLIFAGMIIGDAIAACHFLTKLGVTEYKPEAEQTASCNH